ncbi:aldo/keto reductase [Meiothermus granaticius]|uniref:General stress protein 69 n=1 Tax=Meiothermus granaticius NBRC 107808 TaxID=1227551 RepID=A0A399FA94_9DEIN|nr:aldo/keto reductase [Meiothermus granaticius]RIH93033.1 General stress protein 69 [Meiothermus granaticius NBRC 107808]GEM86692.1 oxidoreductase [Meiothermus granaticius NBRC 107808]
MEERNVGNSGLRVSRVGLGCNNFGGRIGVAASKAVIRKALDLGITLFDTADVYGNRGGSETILGTYLGSERERVVIASKFAMPMDDAGKLRGASRGYILKAIQASLKRLKTDYLDLYQLHTADPHTPIEETLRTLNDLIRQGMVRYIGCSNLPAWQVVEAQWTAKSLGLEGFISIQDEYSLLVRGLEQELLPAARRYGLGLLPYFPLANGLLTGKYRRGEALPEGARLTTNPARAEAVMTEANWQKVERLEAFAKARGHTLLELAFSWLATNPVVSSVIAGATKPEQVEQNANAAGWVLTPEERMEVDQITAAA